MRERLEIRYPGFLGQLIEVMRAFGGVLDVFRAFLSEAQQGDVVGHREFYYCELVSTDTLRPSHAASFDLGQSRGE